MAFFQQCTAGTATLAKQIADSAGASGDNEMTARAGVSLGAAFRHFNSFANWNFMLTEASTMLIPAPFALNADASATGGGSNITFVSTAHGVLPYDFLQGSMFAVPVRITATALTGFAFAETINTSLWTTAGATASGTTFTVNRDRYDLPTLWKQPYSAQIIGAQRTIRYVGRRMYDRSASSQYTAATPQWYDGFNFGQQGKLTLSRPPVETDRLLLKYYRKMDPVSATADIPEQYEPYLVAYAKWHFLMDKGDAMERAKEWKSFASEGLATMLKENVGIPDEDLVMVPGHYFFDMNNSPNSTQNIPWET